MILPKPGFTARKFPAVKHLQNYSCYTHPLLGIGFPDSKELPFVELESWTHDASQKFDWDFFRQLVNRIRRFDHPVSVGQELVNVWYGLWRRMARKGSFNICFFPVLIGDCTCPQDMYEKNVIWDTNSAHVRQRHLRCAQEILQHDTTYPQL